MSDEQPRAQQHRDERTTKRLDLFWGDRDIARYLDSDRIPLLKPIEDSLLEQDICWDGAEYSGVIQLEMSHLANLTKVNRGKLKAAELLQTFTAFMRTSEHTIKTYLYAPTAGNGFGQDVLVNCTVRGIALKAAILFFTF